MEAVGVICEYDPFHRGHLRQLQEIRRALPQASVLCLMSGCFTQRGSPALFSPAARASAALRAGADAVLELPAAFALGDAERFALGGVSILDRLGVSRLSFGVEDDLSLLEPAARLLEAPDASYRAAFRARLEQGLSYAAAQGAALAEALPQSAAALQKPNNILALCYLRAIRRLGSSLRPMPVLRQGDYHASSLNDQPFPSARAVRAAALAGNWKDAEAACGYSLPRTPLCPPDSLDQALLYRLRGTNPEELRGYAFCTEGLENRLLSAARSCTSREALLDAVKTRRYSRARLNRLLTQVLLYMDAEMAETCSVPSCVRLLGLRREAKEAAALLKRSPLPVLSKAADGDRTQPLFQLDERAYDLWALGAGLPAGWLYRMQTVIC